jgi:tRNA threonylcarbamoyladenosine modification (KEOPS) complex  Pcc1 subunit
MAAFGNVKRAVESILVASGDYALVNETANGAALPGGGTRAGATADIPLSSTVNTGHINLYEGQLGIFAAGPAGARNPNVALLSTDTFNTAPAIYIAQGTANAQNPARGNYPLVDNRPYETSGIIYGHNPVILTGKGAAYHAYSIWSIGQPSGGVGSITPFELTEFAIHMGFRGYALDVENSQHSVLATTYRYTTPDYTAIALTDDLDHFVQNYVSQINKNSRAFRSYTASYGGNDPLIALAVGLVANGAQNIDAAGFDNGGVINVQTRNGIQITYTLSAEQVASLRAALPANYGILNVDLTTAGGSADAEWFLVMALDRDLAYDDRVPQVKIRLSPGLLRGFDSTVALTELVSAYEGEGVARMWQIYYTNTHGQRKYYQFQRQHYPFIEVPSSIDPDAYYNAIILEHRNNVQISPAELVVSPKKTIILVPACDDTTMTSILTYLNTWVLSTPQHFVVGAVNSSGELTIATPSLCS